MEDFRSLEREGRGEIEGEGCREVISGANSGLGRFSLISSLSSMRGLLSLFVGSVAGCGEFCLFFFGFQDEWLGVPIAFEVAFEMRL